MVEWSHRSAGRSGSDMRTFPPKPAAEPLLCWRWAWQLWMSSFIPHWRPGGLGGRLWAREETVVVAGVRLQRGAWQSHSLEGVNVRKQRAAAVFSVAHKRSLRGRDKGVEMGWYSYVLWVLRVKRLQLHPPVRMDIRYQELIGRLRSRSFAGSYRVPSG